jgi:hypothetical protein
MVSLSLEGMRYGWTAVAVKALRCAPPADAALRGLDCNPRQPNNQTCRAKGKRKLTRSATSTIIENNAYTKSRTLPMSAYLEASGVFFHMPFDM